MSRLRHVLVLALATALTAPVLAAPAAPAGAAATAEQSARAAAPVTYTVVGQVVRLANGRPVRGVRVSAYNASDGPEAFRGADLTDARGRFVIRDVEADDDEFGIYVQGRRVGVQSGWLGFKKLVYPTFGEAGTWTSQVGRIRVKAS